MVSSAVVVTTNINMSTMALLHLFDMSMLELTLHPIGFVLIALGEFNEFSSDCFQFLLTCLVTCEANKKVIVLYDMS